MPQHERFKPSFALFVSVYVLKSFFVLPAVKGSREEEAAAHVGAVAINQELRCKIRNWTGSIWLPSERASGRRVTSPHFIWPRRRRHRTKPIWQRGQYIYTYIHTYIHDQGLKKKKNTNLQDPPGVVETSEWRPRRADHTRERIPRASLRFRVHAAFLIP